MNAYKTIMFKYLNSKLKGCRMIFYSFSGKKKKKASCTLHGSIFIHITNTTPTALNKPTLIQ